MIMHVEGNCPMGCGETLRLGQDGQVVCILSNCEDNLAVSKILADPETEHLVTFSETAFTVRHPLRERLGDALMKCRLHEDLAALGGAPVDPGLYQVNDEGDGEWSFEPVLP